MFDKMIESDAAESRGRSRYFIVSGLVIGAFFVSAVVMSIYAVNLDLANEEIELSMMLAPVTPNEPEEPRPQQPRNQPAASNISQTAIRNAEIPRLDETPNKTPDRISTDKLTSLARPYGDYKIDPTALETVATSTGAPNGSPFGRGEGKPSGSGSAGSSVEPEATAAKLPDPPPVIPTRPAVPKSLGVINGKATHLPKPPYPDAARAVHATGQVSVQVTIDEAGNVISTKAVNGHPLLRRESEKAALSARFSPTLLSKVPVKVTGVIVYNFQL